MFKRIFKKTKKIKEEPKKIKEDHPKKETPQEIETPRILTAEGWKRRYLKKSK